jgi:formylglycine-generating enzyme required for sulfatase activity
MVRQALLIALVTLLLEGKEFQLESGDLKSVREKVVNSISEDLINRDSVEYSRAKKIRDEVNSRFEQESSNYRNMLLKYSIDLSYLQKQKSDKQRDSEETSILIKNKWAKKEQIESEIENETTYLQNLKALLINGIELSSNISTEGYFVSIVEGERSTKRDQLIEDAVLSINREAIKSLNGTLIESVSKYSKTLSREIREISSGKAISDSSDTTVKIFFTDKNRRTVLIYGTKVDVYPFEKSSRIEVVDGSGSSTQRYVSPVLKISDMRRVEGEIIKRYPELQLSGFRDRVKGAIKKIDSHNKKSLQALRETDQNRQKIISKIERRAEARERSIELLQKQLKIVESEIEELQTEQKSLQRERGELQSRFEELYGKVVEYRNSYTFSKAETYHRKSSDALRETQNIVSEIVTELDKSFQQTSQKIETLYNSSDIFQEVISRVGYQKEYLYARVIPYFIPYTDETGAMVLLKARFKSVDSNRTVQKVATIQKKSPKGFVRIKGGNFQMGSNSGDPDEKPVHLKRIDYDFFIGEYEVTVGEYREFTEATGHPKQKIYSEGCKSDNCPVVGVSWRDAVAYTDWRTQKEGVKYRLPTEAEWEYVAKVGLNLEYGTLFGDIDGFAWFSENSEGKAHSVGEKEPNLWGVYDMYGNVWEWCLDSYSSSYSKGETNAPEKVVRGGAWNIKKAYLRASNRGWSHRDIVRSNIGFRVVRQID